MIKRIIRIILYFILFGINVLVLWYFHSFTNLAILVIMVLFPIVSIIVTRLVAERMSVVFEGPYENMNKGDEFEIRLRLLNPFYIGVMNCYFTMRVSNLFYDTGRQHVLRAPLRARKGQTITYPVTVMQSGRIIFEVLDVTLEDFLGFVAYHRSFDEKYVVYVLPNRESGVLADLNAYTEGMAEVEESTKKGSDFSEVQDVREYQPGDRLQNIHWKLSVKKDILMVKERVSMSSKQLFILMELHDNYDGMLEEVLDCAYGIALLMLQNRIPFSICWWSTEVQELKIWKADYEEALEEGFRMLFYERVYKEQTLGRDMMSTVRGDEQQFLWIGNRDYGIGEALMEHGKYAGVFYGIQQ